MYTRLCHFNGDNESLTTWSLKWYVNLCSKKMLTKNARPAKDVCYIQKMLGYAKKCSECSEDVQISLVTILLPRKRAARFVMEKNTLRGIFAIELGSQDLDHRSWIIQIWIWFNGSFPFTPSYFW